MRFQKRTLFAYFLLAATPLFSQEWPHLFHFSKNDYAAQNQNWAIAQSHEADGSLFFANNGGLLEFDGSRWRTFSLPDAPIVRSVACLDGRVFVGGFAEFGFFEKSERQKWVYHSLSRDLGDDATARREEIWHILTRQNEGKTEVFFQSFGKIYRFDGLKTTRLDPPGGLMFLQKIGPRLVFQVIGRGLYELLPSGGFRFLEGSEPLSKPIVAFILPEKTGDGLVVGTKNDGVFSFKNGRCEPWKNPLNPILKAAQLNKAVRLPDGGWAFGTILSGVFILDSLENERFHLSQATGLQNNTVLSMLADRAGNLWLGLDKGIDLVELNSPLSWFSDQSGRIGSVYAAAIFEGNLYVGTNQGVFAKRWPPRAASGENFQLVEGTQGQVWQLQVFDNQLLSGHNDGTFLIKNPRSARRISEVTGGWATLRLDPRRLVQGTYTGLIIFEKNAAGAWVFSHRVEGFSEPVKKMAFEIGSDGQPTGFLLVSHPNRGRFRIRLSDDGRRIAEIQALPSDEPTEKMLSIEGSDAHFRVLPDEVIFEKKDGKTVVFPLSLVHDWENVVQIAPSLFLFCLEDGYAIWNEKRAASPLDSLHFFGTTRVSAVEILSAGGGWFSPNYFNKNIEKNVESLSELTLSAAQNDLRFYFAAPVFGQKKHWIWSLENTTTGSQIASSANEQTADFIELTNLAAGRYLLRLSLAGDGGWAAPSVFEFRIRRAWWQTGWAVFGWICLAAVLLFLLEKINRRRLARQRAALELEKQRELEAQRAASEKEFLQNEVETRARELSNSTLSLIRKNEILLELKTELDKTALPDRDHDRLHRLIDQNLSSDHDWQVFETAFNEVHDAFFRKMKARWPDLTTGDLRLAAFLKLNLSSKEIASLLGLTVRGVENKRYRLRKKLGMADAENLTEFMMGF